MSNGMKSICITGKHNKYQMKKIISDVERKNETGKMELDKEFYCHRIQLDLIKKLYHIEDETPLQYVSAVPVFVRHIKEKLNGYLSQELLFMGCLLISPRIWRWGGAPSLNPMRNQIQKASQ